MNSMAKKYFAFIISIFLCFLVKAQTPASVKNMPVTAVTVPDYIDFAGMRLELDEAAKAEVQKSVSSLLRYPDFFNAKVDRANMYFPIVERIFKEEGLPDDFKYLVLQESALVSDAVSTSNAIGYWQFKVDAAVEVGLRIDNTMDERKNIVASTRGAAKYLKKNNFYLNNWVYALLSYNLGLGGTKTTALKQQYVGVSTMPIDKSMHWYVLKFLAHKLAFGPHIGKHVPQLNLVEYTQCKNKKLEDIADHFRISADTLKLYNKWLKSDIIPADKSYTVLLPVRAEVREEIALIAAQGDDESVIKINNKGQYKSVEGEKVPIFLTWNGLDAIQAQGGETPTKLALQGGVRLRKFLRINDLEKFDVIIPNQIYYLESKNNDALVLFHTVQPGESVWDVSQMYGIKLESILAKNRMKPEEALQPGRVLYLKSKRPENEPIKFETLSEKLAVAKTDTSKVYHKVELKQTLYGISTKYGTPVDSIKKWNNIGNTPLEVGQLLIVKINKNVAQNNTGTKENQQVVVTKTIPEGFIIHTVAKGETIYKISKSYPNTTVQNILQWNKKINNSVYVGEELLIKK